MDQGGLGDRIRRKLAAAELPRDRPVKIRVGYGQNYLCSACGEVIRPAETEYDLEMPDGESFHMHLGCHGLWIGEVVRRFQWKLAG